MSGLLKDCFTWQGRLGRADFLAGVLALSIPVTGFLDFTWAVIFFAKIPVVFATVGFFFIFFALWLLAFFVEVSLFIRRFHDMGRPGVHVLFLLIPFVNFYFMFLLFFGKSKDLPSPKGSKGAL